MNYICTWFCADEKGEESLFPQTGRKSSSQEHQDIYWRCISVFFITSRRFNKDQPHILFTNVKSIPVVDGKDMNRLLHELDVQIIYTDFKYKTPKGYFGKFQNQFYEFSILEYIAENNKTENDHYLILDSDCIFLKPVNELFNAALPTGFISFEDEVKPDYVINGLSRNNLKSIYEQLLQGPISEVPSYHLGEFLLCSVKNIRQIFEDFKLLWPQLLELNRKGLPKFNEEAHTLSYLYFKNNLRASSDKTFMKRIWTNPLFYRNVDPSDRFLAIWHLPSEKTFGIARLFNILINQYPEYGYGLNDCDYTELVQQTMGIPNLPVIMKVEYYTLSIYRAVLKRIKSLKVIRHFQPAQ